MKSRARALPALLLLAFAAAAPATAAPRRYAVVIGQNSGAPDEQTLRYAVADAERMRRALIDVGGFAVEDVQLLTGVESADVTRTLISLNARMRREANGALLFVYYSGHGDAEALHLAGTRLELNELKSLVEGSAAQARVLVVDACRAGGMTRAKGGHAVPAFEVSLDDTLLAEGTAILTSSAASEDAQESDVLGASFFSHFLVSGMIGAADFNQDGVVTLGEAFAYARERTLSATAQTMVGPQHASFRYALFGQQDLVLTRPAAQHRQLGTLVLSQNGSYTVRRESEDGQVVAEVLTSNGPRRLALAPGTYFVVLRGAKSLFEERTQVSAGGVTEVEPARMQPVEFARVVRKGGTARRAAVSLFAAARGETAELALNPSLGASVGARLDLPVASLELRGSFLTNSHRNDYLSVRTDQYQLELAGLRAFDVGPLTLSIGVEVGAQVFHQRFDTARNPPRTVPAWHLGPTVVLELPLTPRWGLRLGLDAQTTLLIAESSPGDTEFATPLVGALTLGLWSFL